MRRYSFPDHRRRSPPRGFDVLRQTMSEAMPAHGEAARARSCRYRASARHVLSCSGSSLLLRNPVFGLAGFVMPAAAVRGFGTWFYRRKCELLDFEIRRSGKHSAAERFLPALEEHPQRAELPTAADRDMYGSEDPRRQLIEPPFQSESHRYQTRQAADWIAGVVGRLGRSGRSRAFGPKVSCFDDTLSIS